MLPDREYFLYCNGEPVRQQEITEVHFEPPAVQVRGTKMSLDGAFCLKAEMQSGFNTDISGLPIGQRYLVHFEPPAVQVRGTNCLKAEMQLGFNPDISGLPIEQRYLVHCFAKGWRPSVGGLLGFIRLSQLGYYKTL